MGAYGPGTSGEESAGEVIIASIAAIIMVLLIFLPIHCGMKAYCDDAFKANDYPKMTKCIEDGYSRN